MTMRTLTTTAAVLTAGAVALAPLAAATAAGTAAKPKAKFAVTKLSIIRPDATRNVNAADAVIKAQVQVKDLDKKFDPKSVTLVVVEKASGTPVATAAVKAKRLGRSAVVTSWAATITVPKGSVDAGATVSYCLTLVKVDPASPAALPVVATAKGLAGRDCVSVTNKPAPAHGR